MGRTTRMVNSNKADGVYYEQLFIAEALKRGLAVCDTVGDNLPYDVVVMDGAKSYRVQIKGTKGVQDKGTRRYMFSLGVGVNKRVNKNFDIFAGYAEHRNGTAWYIIPREVLQSKTIKIYPDIPDSRGKYERYLGAWTEFKRSR